MPATRDQALAAAVDLVGTEGVRSLTHARVDSRADLPRGSTSNWFRTRSALIAGVVDRIAESERRDFDVPALPSDPDTFVDAFAGMIEAQTDVHGVRTRARMALFLDGSVEAREPLRAHRAVFAAWMREVAGALGMPQPEVAASALMACADGLVLHRLTVDPDVPVRPVVARAVRGCLSPGSG